MRSQHHQIAVMVSMLCLEADHVCYKHFALIFSQLFVCNYSAHPSTARTYTSLLKVENARDLAASSDLQHQMHMNSASWNVDNRWWPWAASRPHLSCLDFQSQKLHNTMPANAYKNSAVSIRLLQRRTMHTSVLHHLDCRTSLPVQPF